MSDELFAQYTASAGNGGVSSADANGGTAISDAHGGSYDLAFVS